MSAFFTLTPEEAAARLCTLEKPAIAMHQRPDGDTVGSAVALFHLFAAMGKKAIGLCSDKIPERLAFLAEGFTVYTALPGEKRDVLAVDVASPGQFGRIAPLLTGDFAPRLMLDHHAFGEPFADHLIDPTAAAAGEIVFLLGEALIQKGLLREIPHPAKCAIYTALSSDTGCFRYSNTTPRTLRIAAQILEDGTVDPADINHRLFEAKSERQLRAEAFAIENTRSTADGKLAWVGITQADKRKLGVEDEHLETMIDMVRSRAGVEVAVAVRETPEGTFKASMRSTGLNVAAVASLFGGGGHVRAAGCSLPGKTLEEGPEALLAVLREKMGQDNTVKMKEI